MQSEYPHECCGAILGELSKAKKIVTNVILLDNHWESISGEGKTRRFRITPKDYQYVELRAKDEGVTLLGFYHSHPDHPPRPSETDLLYAWPFFSYPILSIKGGQFDEVKSFELDGRRFREESIEIYDKHRISGLDKY